MSTGKIRFDTIREASDWLRRNGNSALGSIRTVLSKPATEGRKPKAATTAAKRALNRNSLPLKNDDLVAEKTTRCETEKGCWGTFKCADFPGEEGHTNRTQWILGCKSPNCTLCRRAYSTKRARECWGRGGDPEKSKGAMRYLNAENKVSYWYIVLTFPLSCRPKITQETVKTCRDAFWKAFQEFAMNRQGLEGQDLHMGSMHVMHPVGDKEDGEGEKVFHPHLNFIIPGIAFGEYKAPDGMVYAQKRLKMWLFKRELDELRKIWKGILQKTFDVRIRTDVTLDVSHRGLYRQDLTRAIREQKHCLKYNFRSFPGWPQWTRRITNYGYLATRKIGKFRHIWEMWEPTDYKEPLHCECGAPIEVETEDPGAQFLPIDPDWHNIEPHMLQLQPSGP